MKILKNIVALILMLWSAWILGFAAFSLFAILAPPQQPQTNTDAIIVLTGGNNRIQEGLSLFAQKKAPHLFISGVHKDVTKPEILALWSGKEALPPCCMTLGYQATSTEGNAVETRDWVAANKIKTIRLVTGNYHMVRALLELRHMLPGVKIYMHPVEQPELGLETKRFWIFLFVEYHKSFYRCLQLLLP
jgi:uncharacterized SAM-binding protein YcdF (DUF218 family)